MMTTIRKLGATLSPTYTVAVCGIALLFGASSLRAQATRDLNRAATSVSAASTFFPPRVERDDARDRIWSLSEGEVLLYHGRARTWAKTIALRGWSSVGAQHSCAADIAVDVAGNVIVSSNIAPTLWRIDAKSLEAERLDIVLDADPDKDVGFTGLLSTSRDRLYAISAIHGSLWRIDLNARRATKLEMANPLNGACALGFAPQAERPRTLLHVDLMPTLHLCASTRTAARRINVTGLAQATLMKESCSAK